MIFLNEELLDNAKAINTINEMEEYMGMPLSEDEKKEVTEKVKEKATDANEKVKDTVKKSSKKTKETEEKADKAFKGLRHEFIKFYEKPEEELINNYPNLFKLVRRYVTLSGIYFGVGAFGGPALAVTAISWYTARVVRRKMTAMQKEKVIEAYLREIKVNNAKLKDLEGSDDPSDKAQKYNLIKINDKLRKDVSKLRTKKVE